jgi:hypothetical protein
LNPASPNIEGIRMHFCDDGNGKFRMFLRLSRREDWELFLALCRDIVSASRQSEGPKSALAIIIRRLQRWQAFLSQRRRDLLPEEKIKGLIGELLFLKNHLIPSIGIQNAITAWRGPYGAPQDFSFASYAVEAKCKSGSANPSVRISSAEQLTSPLPNLFLYVVTLSRCGPSDPGAVNVLSLVKVVRDECDCVSAISCEEFNNALLELHFLEDKQYEEFSYFHVGTSCFRVFDSFPRITTDMVNPVLERVSYSIPISACESFSEFPDFSTL